jgi:hypothetical protein
MTLAASVDFLAHRASYSPLTLIAAAAMLLAWMIRQSDELHS